LVNTNGVFLNTGIDPLPVLVSYTIGWNDNIDGLYTYVLLGAGTRYGELYYNMSVDSSNNIINNHATFVLAANEYFSIYVNNPSSLSTTTATKATIVNLTAGSGGRTGPTGPTGSTG
jgi:hypothetical protein